MSSARPGLTFLSAALGAVAAFGLIGAGAARGSPLLSLDVGTEAGFETNVRRTFIDAPAEGAGYGSGWASGGALFFLGERLEGTVDVTWSGWLYPTALDVAAQDLWLQGGMALWLDEVGVDLRLTPRVGFRHAADAARTALRAGGSAAARLRPARFLDVRLTYSYLANLAVTAGATTWDLHALALRVSLRPWAGTSLSVSYAADLGADLAAASPTKPMTWSLPALADTGLSLGHAASVGLYQALVGPAYVEAGYTWVLAQGAAWASVSHQPWLALGVHLDHWL